MLTHTPAAQIYLRHCGLCEFQGIPELQTVIQISRGALDGRTFPAGFANPKKATNLGHAKGLQAVLVLEAQEADASWAS